MHGISVALEAERDHGGAPADFQVHEGSVEWPAQRRMPHARSRPLGLPAWPPTRQPSPPGWPACWRLLKLICHPKTPLPPQSPRRLAVTLSPQRPAAIGSPSPVIQATVPVIRAEPRTTWARARLVQTKPRAPQARARLIRPEFPVIPAAARVARAGFRVARAGFRVIGARPRMIPWLPVPPRRNPRAAPLLTSPRALPLRPRIAQPPQPHA
jgi:hypothetical protein